MENLGKIEGILEGMHDSLEDVKKAIFGNGRPGLKDDFIRAEEAIKNLRVLIEDEHKNRCEEMSEINDSIKELSTNVSALTKLMEKHVEDKDIHIANRKVDTLKALFLNKESMLYAVLAFATLHAIFPDFNVIEAIKKIIGL